MFRSTNIEISISTEDKQLLLFGRKEIPAWIFPENGTRYSLSFVDQLGRTNCQMFLDARKQKKNFFALEMRTRPEEWSKIMNVAPGRYGIFLVEELTGSRRRTLDVGTCLDIEQVSKIGSGTTSVSVIGSCVTRDNFNSRIAPKWKNSFELLHEFYQSSFISLFSSPLNLEANKLNDLDNFSQQMVLKDFNKSYLEQLKTSPPKKLIIDFRADLRFGLIRVDNSFVTNNKWKLGRSAYYKELSQCKRLSLDADQSLYLNEFNKAIDRFESFRRKYLSSTDVILNDARSVKYLNDEGCIQEIDSDFGDSKNPLWDILDNQFLELPNILRMNAWSMDLVGNSSHPWGVGPVHYEEVYYQRFSRRLRHLSGQEIRFSIAKK